MIKNITFLLINTTFIKDHIIKIKKIWKIKINTKQKVANKHNSLIKALMNRTPTDFLKNINIKIKSRISRKFKYLVDNKSAVQKFFLKDLNLLW